MKEKKRKTGKNAGKLTVQPVPAPIQNKKNRPLQRSIFFNGDDGDGDDALPRKAKLLHGIPDAHNAHPLLPTLS